MQVCLHHFVNQCGCFAGHFLGVVRIEVLRDGHIGMAQAGGYIDWLCSGLYQSRSVGVPQGVEVDADFAQVIHQYVTFYWHTEPPRADKMMFYRPVWLAVNRWQDFHAPLFPYFIDALVGHSKPHAFFCLLFFHVRNSSIRASFIQIMRVLVGVFGSQNIVSRCTRQGRT